MKYNKRVGWLLLGVGAITMAIDGDATVFAFLGVMALALFSAKVRVVY